MNLFLTDPTSHTEGESVQNLGDIIIKDAVADHFSEVSAAAFDWVPIDLKEKPILLSDDSLLILAGANIIANNPHFNRYVWRPGASNRRLRNFLILFGVGWWKYQRTPGFMTKCFYNRYLLKETIQHSVRDGYTLRMLNKAGIGNVINTGCPTMWRLPERLSFQRDIERVVFTLTDYSRDPEKDRALINELFKNYDSVFFFPQGTGDERYMYSLLKPEMKDKITVLARSIEAYNSILSYDPIDYVGTRLHAGIRALQYGRRAFIVALDNRAVEISKDTGLPVLKRTDAHRLSEMKHNFTEFALNINRDGIREFKERLANFLERKN